MLYILFFLIIFFLFFNLLLKVSLLFLFRSDNNKQSYEYDLSVVIPLKNEEENIPALFNSLLGQDYPDNKYEIIFVDDNSTDNSFNLLNKLSGNYKNIKIIKAVNKNLPGKKGALAIGIDNSQNPFILTTDADCILDKEWLKSFAGMFKAGFDFVFGIINVLPGKSFLNNLVRFENLRTSILTFGLVNLRFPYSSGGASFGFRKDSFFKIHGYNNITEVLSGDDDLIIREAVKHKMKIGSVVNKEAFVYTESPADFNQYLKQKTRHTTTSNYYLFKHKIILTSWHLVNLGFLLSPILSFINIYFLLLFFIKLFVDEITILFSQKKFGYKFGVFQIFYLQFIYELLLIYHYLSATIKKNIEWK
jgi:cellulose synthase/poly-beta-1,6-N-acetylglucosamine synthase-like glycosyltransferase